MYFNAGQCNQGNVAKPKMNKAKQWEARLEIVGWSLCVNRGLEPVCEPGSRQSLTELIFTGSCTKAR